MLREVREEMTLVHRQGNHGVTVKRLQTYAQTSTASAALF